MKGSSAHVVLGACCKVATFSSWLREHAGVPHVARHGCEVRQLNKRLTPRLCFTTMAPTII